MPKPLENGIVVWTAGDDFQPMAQIEKVAETSNVVIPVYSLAERNALTKREGLTVTRLDRNGALEIWNGLEWVNERGAPVGMWRMLEGDGSAMTGIAAGAWTTITNWATVPNSPLPSESGINYANGVMTIPRAGKWHISACAAMGDYPGVDLDRLDVRINPSVMTDATARAVISPFVTATVTKPFLLDAGETVSIDVQHNSGTVKGLHSHPSSQWWTVEYLGPK